MLIKDIDFVVLSEKIKKLERYDQLLSYHDITCIIIHECPECNVHDVIDILIDLGIVKKSIRETFAIVGGKRRSFDISTVYQPYMPISDSVIKE